MCARYAVLADTSRRAQVRPGPPTGEGLTVDEVTEEFRRLQEDSGKAGEDPTVVGSLVFQPRRPTVRVNGRGESNPRHGGRMHLSGSARQGARTTEPLA